MDSTTTRLITIPDYSKLLRWPAADSPQDKSLDTFQFRGHVWLVMMYIPAATRGISDCLIFGVTPPWRSLSASGTKISIEILDESGEHTVFDTEQTLYNDTSFKSMLVSRRELEASSCVRNDSLTLRCTLSEPTMIFKEPQVVFAGSHMLTIDNFSKHKAALEFRECVRSTRFSVGGSTWYIKLNPNMYYASKPYLSQPSLLLARASSDEPATTAEFKFELLAEEDDGVKYHRSTKVTRMFDCASPEHAQPVPSTWTANRFIVRCSLAVIKGEPVLTPSSSDKPATTAEFKLDDDQPVPSTSTAKHDSHTVRCTLSLHTRKLSNYLKNLRSFFKPKMIFKEPKVVLAGSLTRSRSTTSPNTRR